MTLSGYSVAGIGKVVVPVPGDQCQTVGACGGEIRRIEAVVLLREHNGVQAVSGQLAADR